MSQPKIIAIRQYGPLVIVYLATDEGRISFRCCCSEIIPMPNVKFPLGQLVATPGALQALQESGQSPLGFLSRHAQGDWGDLCPEDKQLNEDGLKDGDRIFSAYHTTKGVKLYVITEHDRSVTTILLPEEY